MSIETELFNGIFENKFFIECNSFKDNKWEDIFQDLYLKNRKHYEDFLGKSHLEEILKIVKKYYQNINQIRNENQLLYEYLKNISGIKFKLKTRLKSLNSILEKIIKMKDVNKIYDIDASTIIITEYREEDISKLKDEKQLKIFQDIIRKIDIFYSSIQYYPTNYGNDYLKRPKVGKVLNMKVKEQYFFDLNTNEIPRYFSLHKSYENTKEDRIKEIHINTWETEKAIRGNTTLNHYIYKPCPLDKFLIFNVPKHLDILDDCILEYDLIEGFDYNFYNQISFNEYLSKFYITNNVIEKAINQVKIKMLKVLIFYNFHSKI